jgi:hypothetical protein
MESIVNSQSIIVDNQYFSCVNYYSSLFMNADIKIEACEHYRKMSFRNRCVVAGSNGLINLSVPLQNGRDQKGMIKEVRIDNWDNWQRQHWHTIFSCYGNSPFFEFYREEVETLFRRKFTYLFDLNLEALDWVKKTIKLPGQISLTETFLKTYPAEVDDARNRWLPKNFQQDEKPMRYIQVFEEKIRFQPNLSILDLLFCEGPQTAFIPGQHFAQTQHPI